MPRNAHGCEMCIRDRVDSNKKMVMVAENISKHFDEAMTMLNDLDESVAVSHSSIQEMCIRDSAYRG